MKCEICQENEATIHLTQVVDGQVKKLHLCESCASENGFDIHSPMSITDILLGMAGQTMPAFSSKPGQVMEQACPQCHLRRADFKKSGRLGCPFCYDAFADQIVPLLKVMHRNEQHQGKVPRCEKSRVRSTVEIEALQESLRQAIAGENYEEAARLRDEIQTLRNASDDSGGAGS
jgi:protein arginine kinase activator